MSKHTIFPYFCPSFSEMSILTLEAPTSHKWSNTTTKFVRKLVDYFVGLALKGSKTLVTNCLRVYKVTVDVKMDGSVLEKKISF